MSRILYGGSTCWADAQYNHHHPRSSFSCSCSPWCPPSRNRRQFLTHHSKACFLPQSRTPSPFSASLTTCHINTVPPEKLIRGEVNRVESGDTEPARTEKSAYHRSDDDSLLFRALDFLFPTKTRRFLLVTQIRRGTQ